MATGQGRDGRPPIEEIAQALGISKTTVSRALSGKGRVSEETRARVFAYVGRPGGDSSTPVRRQDPGATHNLSLVIPKHFMQLDLPFLRKCMGGVCTMAAQRGYDLLLCYVSDTDTVQLERQLASHKVDGVILSRTMNDDPSIDLLQQYGVPFVAIGRIENDDIPQADNDQLGAASEMTRVLFQMGARRIAYLGGSGTYTVNADRLRGYLRGLAEFGVPADQSLIRTGIESDGEGLGLPKELATEGRMAAAFRAAGANYVFDTNFAADLTIMEEGSELLYKMKHSWEFRRPLFTSCCPGWVRFLKLEYPDMVPQLSTAKSPQQMFGAVTKTWFAKTHNIDPKDIFCVSVMPCVAKKYECAVPEINSSGFRDVDAVLTTREVDRLLRLKWINVADLPEEEFDSPLGEGTGAAVIFGATGGVMEAALRTAYAVLEGHNPDPDAFQAVRGTDGRKEISATIGGVPVRACVASGLANARAVVEDIRAGRAQYDFVEIMACPGGCAGGGGQPFQEGMELAGERGETLYEIDRNNPVRFSHENASVQKAYDDFFDKPLSHRSHELLHTDQTKWSLR